jgi:hypothetical protein
MWQVYTQFLSRLDAASLSVTVGSGSSNRAISASSSSATPNVATTAINSAESFTAQPNGGLCLLLLVGALIVVRSDHIKTRKFLWRHCRWRAALQWR